MCEPICGIYCSLVNAKGNQFYSFLNYYKIINMWCEWMNVIVRDTIIIGSAHVGTNIGLKKNAVWWYMFWVVLLRSAPCSRNTGGGPIKWLLFLKIK
jgi:hypothetical protein